MRFCPQTPISHDFVGLEELCPTTLHLSGGMLAAAFWIFWRNRTPYPGLKKPSPTSAG